jgi:hypothetical protein
VSMVRIKPSVTSILTPAGIRILSALDYVAQTLSRDVTITSGSDGDHSGPSDPHKLGLAYDIRTKDDPDKQQLITALLNRLAATDQGRFYAFIEDDGGPNEHIHCQLRRGTTYP